MKTVCACHFCFSQILKKLKELSVDTRAELGYQGAALDDIDEVMNMVSLTADKHNRRMKKPK